MSTSSALPTDLPPPPHHLACLEILGGTRAGRQSLAMPGMDAWVFSLPHDGAASGGDIHFISSCFTGRVCRFVLADVSGHGQHAADLAATLRRLMRRHINYLDQTHMARVLNQEFARLNQEGRFATAVLMSYFSPTDQLIVCNAGHPRPLWYHAQERRWELLEHSTPEADLGVNNLPLGVIEPTDYRQFSVPLRAGDWLLLYTDSLTEARPPEGDLLGEEGLRALAEGLDLRAEAEPEAVGQALLEAVRDYRRGCPAEDDQTLIVLKHNASPAPPRVLRNAVRRVAAMLGLAGD